MPVAQQPRSDPSPRTPADAAPPPAAPRHAGLILIGLLATVAAVIAALGIALYQPGDSTPAADTPSPPPPSASHGIAGVPAVATSTPGFPAPPRGAVVYARADGSDVLALAVLPRSPLVVQ